MYSTRSLIFPLELFFAAFYETICLVNSLLYHICSSAFYIRALMATDETTVPLSENGKSANVVDAESGRAKFTKVLRYYLLLLDISHFRPASLLYQLLLIVYEIALLKFSIACDKDRLPNNNICIIVDNYRWLYFLIKYSVVTYIVNFKRHAYYKVHLRLIANAI